jgi:hypothetical protein
MVLKNRRKRPTRGWNTMSRRSNQRYQQGLEKQKLNKDRRLEHHVLPFQSRSKVALIHVSQLMFFQFYNTRWFHLWSTQRREKLFNNFWHASFVLLEKIFTFLTSILRPMVQQFNGYVQRGVEEMTSLESTLGPRMPIAPIIINA